MGCSGSFYIFFLFLLCILQKFLYFVIWGHTEQLCSSKGTLLNSVSIEKCRKETSKGTGVDICENVWVLLILSYTFFPMVQSQRNPLITSSTKTAFELPIETAHFFILSFLPQETLGKKHP